MMMVVAAFLNLIERYGAMAAWPMGMDGQGFMGACTGIPKDVRGSEMQPWRWELHPSIQQGGKFSKDAHYRVYGFSSSN